MTENKSMADVLLEEAADIDVAEFSLEPETVTSTPTLMDQVELKLDEDVREKVHSAGAVNESMLSDSERQKVNNLSNSINIADTRMIDAYGSDAQSGIAAFSKSLTSKAKTKELGSLGDSLRELKVAITSTNLSEKKGLFGLFGKSKDKVEYLISNYQTVEKNVECIEEKLQNHRQILLKDVYVYDEMYKKNLQYYKKITMYIIAGRKALDTARTTTLVELRSKALATEDQMDIQTLGDFEAMCRRFDRRLADLEVSRLISIQQAPQIRQLQEMDHELSDRLRADILNTIPLWRNQMALALGIRHAKDALDAQLTLNQMTNEMLIANSRDIKSGSIDVAEASERSIVDIETLRKCNEDIIASINEVVKIHEEGAARREKDQAELAKIESELKKALLEVGSRS